MCIVIDASALSCVFNPRNEKYRDFEPLYDWIYDGNGFIVYGGKTYLDQLIKCPKIHGIFKELKNKRKAVRVKYDLVNKEEERIKELVPNANFNDRHLVAIILVSWCKLICSLDKDSHRFIKDTRFFEKGRKPKIYQNRRHKKLLSDDNIVKIRNEDTD